MFRKATLLLLCAFLSGLFFQANLYAGTDRDGVPDHIDLDGVNDGLVEGDRLETAVIGSMGSFTLFGLLLLGMRQSVCKKFQTKVQNKRYPLRAVLAVLGIVLVQGLIPSDVIAAGMVDMEAGKEANTCAHYIWNDWRYTGDDPDIHGAEFDRCWYIGLGLGFGRSEIDSEKSSNGWASDNDENHDSGFAIYFGKRLSPHWFIEGRYADLGESGLVNVNRLQDAAYPDAAITYTVPSLVAGFYLRNERARLKPFLKAGLSMIQNKSVADNGTTNYEDQTAVQLAVGVGLEWHFKYSSWFVRADLDAYDRGAQVVMASLGKFIGGRKVEQEVPPAVMIPELVSEPEPEVVSPKLVVVPEPKIECSTFKMVADLIRFEVNSAQLTNSSRHELDGIAVQLSRAPSVRVEVQAHTDSVGSSDYNMVLSDRRAASVMRYLLDQGVVYGQLNAMGYGESQPRDTNDTPEGRQRNRRVEFVLLDDQVCQQSL